MVIATVIKRRIEEARVSYNASDNISKYIYSDYERDVLKAELTLAFARVLECLVIDPNDPNSKDTPERLAKMYIDEIMRGRYYRRPETTAFPNESKYPYTGMLVVRAEIKSLCAHHHQPVTGICYIGIIPNGTVLGLSKYVRIAQWCARRGTLQEELTEQIATEIRGVTGTDNVAVHIRAEHGCMTNRGIDAHSSLTQTTVLHGQFKEADVKAEYFENIKMQDR